MAIKDGPVTKILGDFGIEEVMRTRALVVTANAVPTTL